MYTINNLILIFSYKSPQNITIWDCSNFWTFFPQKLQIGWLQILFTINGNPYLLKLHFLFIKKKWLCELWVWVQTLFKIKIFNTDYPSFWEILIHRLLVLIALFFFSQEIQKKLTLDRGYIKQNYKPLFFSKTLSVKNCYPLVIV